MLRCARQKGNYHCCFGGFKGVYPVHHQPEGAVEGHCDDPSQNSDEGREHHGRDEKREKGRPFQYAADVTGYRGWRERRVCKTMAQFQ